jgi:hypothetical protein
MIINFKLDTEIKNINVDEYASIKNIKNQLKDIFKINNFNLYRDKELLSENKSIKLYGIVSNDTISINPILLGGKFSILKIFLTIIVVFFSLFLIISGFIPLFKLIVSMVLNKIKFSLKNLLVTNRKHPRNSLYGFITFFIDFINFVLLFVLLYVIVVLPVLLWILMIKGKNIFHDPTTYSKYYTVAYISSIIIITIYIMIYFLRYRLLNGMLSLARKLFGWTVIFRYTILAVIEAIIGYLNKTKINPIMSMLWDKVKEFIKNIIIKFHIENSDNPKGLDGCSNGLFEKLTEQYRIIEDKINSHFNDENKNSNEYKKKYLDKLNSYFKTLEKGSSVNDITLQKVPELMAVQSYLTDRKILLYLLNIIDPIKFKEMEKQYNDSFIIGKIFGTSVDFIIGKLIRYLVCNKVRLIVNTDTIITEFGDPDEIIDILASGMGTGRLVAPLLFILLIILLILGFLRVY